MTTLLDSCILIDCLARHAPARACIQSQVRPAISLITWMEVMVGGPKAGNDPIVRKFLDAFEILLERAHGRTSDLWALIGATVTPSRKRT